jgi:hypothetical protein
MAVDGRWTLLEEEERLLRAAINNNNSKDLYDNCKMRNSLLSLLKPISAHTILINISSKIQNS